VVIIVIVIVIGIVVMIQPAKSQSDELQVMNRGRKFNLSRRGVEASLLNVTPDRVTKYGIVIRGQEYSVLQVMAVATEMPKIEWSTVNAYRILQKLGFEILIH